MVGHKRSAWGVGEGAMRVTLVFGQPGFAVDWDWATGLTVWSVIGDRAGVRLATGALTHRPTSERAAVRAARRWWLAEGKNLAAGNGLAGDHSAEAPPPPRKDRA
jgi:hypothetical protein